MRYAAEADTAHQRWPRSWRALLIGLCMFILCSCRGPQERPCDTPALHGQAYATLPPEAYTGVPTEVLEDGSNETWSPPGIARPWPQDEYLRDGGDRGLPAKVEQDWEVHGLELEDTIAHYDRLDGQTEVETSNRVHIYSPRFGAVRQVVGLMAHDQARRLAGVHQPEMLAAPREVQIVASSKQNLQTERQIGTKPLEIFRGKQGDGVVSSQTQLSAFHDNDFKAFENLQVIRRGVMESAEMAWLARGTAAAIAWENTRSVEVILDHRGAMADVGVENLNSVFTYKTPPGTAKLQLVKVASTQYAEPGDEVAFTLRFDNVGTQVIGNVTIIDNLSTRLEYIPDSAQCSLPAEFFTQPNEGDSLVIRCEVADPLPPGEGGIIRFRCRVR